MSLPVRGLGEGSTHGLLGEEFSIDANGIPLTFATEAGAARCVCARARLSLSLSLRLFPPPPPLPLFLSGVRLQCRR